MSDVANNRISGIWSGGAKAKILAPFLTAGYPSLDATVALLRDFERRGVRLCEIGIPFSDPIADGPVNQRAALRAIAGGLHHEKFFKLVYGLRRYTDMPMGVLMYANSALHVGYETFCKRAADAGVDGILVADMPPEEASGMLEAMRANHLHSVFIVSELTPPQRMRRICDAISGFVYVVSRLGTTGVQVDLTYAPTAVRTDRARLVLTVDGHVYGIPLVGSGF